MRIAQQPWCTWTHDVGQEKAGQLSFPNGSRIPGNVHDTWRWFDSQIKGLSNGVEKLPAVTYYVMGDTNDPAAPGNVWRTADRWPHRSHILLPVIVPERAPLMYRRRLETRC